MDDSVVILNSGSNVSHVLEQLHVKINETIDLVGVNLRTLRDFKLENNFNHSIEGAAIDVLIDAIEGDCEYL